MLRINTILDILSRAHKYCKDREIMREDKKE